MNLHPKKSHSQNFLINKGIIQKIIDAGELSNKDIILEIGPGKGALTEVLIGNVGKVIAVEKDKELYNFLLDRFANIKNLELLNQDILKLDVKKYIKVKNYKLIANIPYNITGKIFRKFLLSEESPSMIIVMVQHEVGERLLGKNKSILSLMVELYGSVERVCKVSAGSFFPIPKVDSAVIKLTKGQKYKNELQILELIKIGFSQRRKKLISNLFKKVKDISTGEEVDKNSMEKLFKSMGLKADIRAEQLLLVDWLKLAEGMVKK